MKMRKLAVIGDPASVMIFNAIGFAVFYDEQQAKIEHRIHKLAEEGYAVIYITEKAAALVPAIIPIPASTGNLGIGMKQLKGNVEKAVGADILFKEG